MKARFSRYVWIVLGYNLAVILWGAYVRATGSGAGCGAHWPLCQGVVVPRSPEAETIIELSHRLSSGLVLIFALILVLWAFRVYPRGSYLRKSAAWTMGFTLSEALVGAGLVLFGLTGQDDSAARAFSIAVHLVNTFLLLAAISLTAWWSSRGEPERLAWRREAWLALIALVGTVFIGVSGAITALGDTLFPADSFAQGFVQDFSPTAHFLVRLRIYHPLVAVIVSGYILICLRRMRQEGWGARTEITTLLIILIILQLVAGAVNVVLLAPVWMQLVHLLLADLVWISLILTGGLLISSPRLPVDRFLHQPVEEDVKEFPA